MNQVKAGAILNYLIIGLNTIVGLAYTPYLLRCLGQNEYGLYSLVSSVIAYLTILDFGFGNAIIRYTAKFRAEGQTERQWEMFGMFLIVYSIIGVVAFCGGLGLYFNVEVLFDRTMTASDISQARIMMLLLMVNLAFTFPFSIFGSIISAYENFVFQRVVNICRILLCTAVMIALLAVGYKAIALVVVNTVFNLLTLLINYFYCVSKLKIKIRFKRFDVRFFKEIVSYSFWIFLNAIMDKVYWGTGQFVLGAISGTTAVAIFSVAIMLEQMYMTFSTSFVSVMLPRVTSMVTLRNSDKEISDLFIRTGRIQNLVMSLILSGFIVFGASFIKLWAGAGYSDSFPITLIFFVTLYVPLIQNMGITILQARNQMKFRSLLYVSIAAVSLVFQVVLSKRYGTIGCAAAIGGALILGQGIVMNVYYYVRQHIDIPLFWRENLRQLVVPCLLASVFWQTNRFIDYSHPAYLILGIVVYSFIFIVSVWKFSMNDYERALFEAPLRKFLKRHVASKS